MGTEEDRQFQKLLAHYPLDRCREVATYVLECVDAPGNDWLCASGILNALEVAEHAQDLTVIEVIQRHLCASGRPNAKRLWARYGEGESSNSFADSDDPS